MLIASYLVGYNTDMTVGHVGVDRVFPDDVADARYELREIQLGSNTQHDLLIYFPRAAMPQNLVCLPELPEIVVELLLDGKLLPVLDFATGQLIENGAECRDKRDCA